jgi:hypothetical protein
MPVIWLLRYANRTSNLKTALTRKYRIGNLYVTKDTYIMHKVQDYNNSAHPVTCEGQHLTRISKHLHDRSFN